MLKPSNLTCSREPLSKTVCRPLGRSQLNKCPPQQKNKYPGADFAKNKPASGLPSGEVKPQPQGGARAVLQAEVPRGQEVQAGGVVSEVD